MVGVASGNLQADSITARVIWLGLRVGGRMVLFHIHHMNRVNSRSGSELRRQHHKHYCGNYYYYVCLECFYTVGRQEGNPACKSSATTILSSLLLDTGLTWTNSRKMGRLTKNGVTKTDKVFRIIY